MEFCDECGSSRTEIDRKNSKVICKACGFEKKFFLENFNKKSAYSRKNGEKQIVVLDKKYTESKYRADYNCPHCRNREAYVQHIPPRWGDEDNLSIYTCTKCGKSTREGFSH